MTLFLTVLQVIKIHDTALQLHGGLQGIRDQGSLISAIETPKATMFGQFLHPTIYNKAAAYLFHIVQNHPFNDGNKRTGAGAALLFLAVNGVEIAQLDDDAFEELVVEVACGKIEKSPVSIFLEQTFAKVIAITDTP